MNTEKPTLPTVVLSTAQLGDVLGRVMKWTPVSIPPDMRMGEYGWLTSEPVLGFTRWGQMQVVTYEQIDEDCAPRWNTNCSERWDATDSLMYWVNLPQPPNLAISGE